ncbi:hypothetical protein J6590_038933 [Homalodisca vitripennis]|nr:hypothetical protein J6590_038933 [Homalodisca vitripennis]
MKDHNISHWAVKITMAKLDPKQSNKAYLYSFSSSMSGMGAKQLSSIQITRGTYKEWTVVETGCHNNYKVPDPVHCLKGGSINSVIKGTDCVASV